MRYTLILLSLIAGVVIYMISPLGKLKNYGPDFLWAFAFALAINGLSKTSFTIKPILTVTIVGVFYELGQKYGLWSGTYDPLDITVYVFGAIIGQMICAKKILRFN